MDVRPRCGQGDGVRDDRRLDRRVPLSWCARGRLRDARKLTSDSDIRTTICIVGGEIMVRINRGDYWQGLVVCVDLN